MDVILAVTHASPTADAQLTNHYSLGATRHGTTQADRHWGGNHLPDPPQCGRH